jgi:pyruvate/2-oxoglutarate dehydrogenase complex dihydrolipoamide dehydrogenase (E3) component
MGLDTAGVKFSPAGIETDDQLGTTNPAVYAAGDVGMPEKYTHAGIATMTPADLAAVIACYPTQFEAIRRVAARASTS